MIRRLRLWWARRRLMAANANYLARVADWKMGKGRYDELLGPAARRTALCIDRVNRLERTPGEPWTR